MRVTTIAPRLSAGAHRIASAWITLKNWANGFRPALAGFESSESREDPMEMRIVVPDAAGATALAERLTIALGAERISLRGEHPEVDVLIDGEPDPVIVRAVDAVERWFEQAGVGTVEMWLGERSYRLARWVPVEAWH